MHLFLTLLQITGYSKISAAVIWATFLSTCKLLILKSQTAPKKLNQQTHYQRFRCFRVFKVLMWKYHYPVNFFKKHHSVMRKIQEKYMQLWLLFFAIWCTMQGLRSVLDVTAPNKKPDINNSMRLWDSLILCPLRPSLLSSKIEE